jgi:hypothetical protein
MKTLMNLFPLFIWVATDVFLILPACDVFTAVVFRYPPETVSSPVYLPVHPSVLPSVANSHDETTDSPAAFVRCSVELDIARYKKTSAMIPKIIKRTVEKTG